MRRLRSAFLAAVLGLGALAGLSAEAGAFGWLSRIAREAGELGGSAALKAGKTGIGALDNAAAHLAGLPKLPGGGAALAAHVTPEGHWKFVNREGLVYTAATPDELARVGTALAPDAAPSARLTFYLSEDTVFTQRAAIGALPADAELHVVVGRDAYRLRNAGGDAFAAVVRPNVVVALRSRQVFDEAIYRLSRPLNRSSIRTLALEPGGPGRLSSVPRFDPATKAALVDRVDPAALPAALASLRGQSALVSGRIDGNVLSFRPSTGPEQTLDVAQLVKAAADADVNLVLLNTAATHQPGGRNWLWQRVEVAGLDEAMKRATYADFLSALGGTGNELAVNASFSAQGRILLSAVPTRPALPITETVGKWIGWENWLGDITGDLALRSVEIAARDSAQEEERDSRIVPGIPSDIQYAYLGALVMGLLAWPVTMSWWRRVWPPEQREEYRGRVGYWSARGVRALACTAIFVPLVGIPALLWLGALKVWNVATAPIRGLKWLFNRLSPRRA